MSDEKLIMTREEMLKKLDAGEDPLDVSIEKWESLIKWIKLNPDEEPDADWYSTPTCALCEVNHHNCFNCVIHNISCCEHNDSVWMNFWLEPTVLNAQKMLDVLKSAKV